MLFVPHVAACEVHDRNAGLATGGPVTASQLPQFAGPVIGSGLQLRVDHV